MMPEEKYAALDSCDGGTPVVAKPGTAMLPNLIDVCASCTQRMCLFMHMLVTV